MEAKGYTVRIHNDFVIQDQAKIDKILERIERIVSASYARASKSKGETK
jgi:hypothetical protein